MKLIDIINGETKLLGLIGEPVEHSISPIIHNTLSKHLNKNLTYLPFRVENESLEDAVKGLRAINVQGFNITVPYKREIMKYIDENSRESILMGAINTVKNINGRFHGYNTDAEGFSRSFKEEAGFGFKDKKVIMIGAGGAARAVAIKLAMEDVSSLIIINRTVSKAEEIASIVNDNILNIAKAYGLDDSILSKEFEESDIIINTTAVGMYPKIDEMPISEEFIKGHHTVYDVIYNPENTKLLKIAKSKGCTVINGLGMLIYQGVLAYEIWTGMKIEQTLTKELVEVMRKKLDL